MDSATVERYRRNYGLGAEIGADHVQRHWDLERRLTARLLHSTPADRWAVFEECYSTLYDQLPWLNTGALPDERRYRQWLKLLKPGDRVFEVGSGRASLLNYLAAKGFDCTATEITRERGAKFASGGAVRWRTTDGVHLDEFEPTETFDVVISSEVIEHFHPDDLPEHLRSARVILKKGGRYIFTTPHASSGPHDLSGVFGAETAQCMHLKEYRQTELMSQLKAAGFHRVRAVFPPGKVYSLVPICFISGVYLRYLMLWDSLEDALQLGAKTRKALRKVLQLLLVGDRIWLVAD